MTIKDQITRFKDMAEVACASYGYFHLIGEKLDKDSLKKLGKDEHIIQEVDILDIAYKGLTAEGHIKLVNPKELDGDFTLKQTQRFFERYEIAKHQENTKGNDFSATLFKDTGMIEGKKVKDKEQYIFAIRENQTINHLEVCNGYK